MAYSPSQTEREGKYTHLFPGTEKKTHILLYTVCSPFPEQRSRGRQMRAFSLSPQHYNPCNDFIRGGGVEKKSKRILSTYKEREREVSPGAITFHPLPSGRRERTHKPSPVICSTVRAAKLYHPLHHKGPDPHSTYGKPRSTPLPPPPRCVFLHAGAERGATVYKKEKE